MTLSVDELAANFGYEQIGEYIFSKKGIPTTIEWYPLGSSYQIEFQFTPPVLKKYDEKAKFLIEEFRRNINIIKPVTGTDIIPEDRNHIIYSVYKYNRKEKKFPCAMYYAKSVQELQALLWVANNFHLFR